MDVDAQILEFLDQDQDSRQQLQKAYNCDSIVDLMFEQSMTALQKISRKKECQDMIQNVFHKYKQNMIRKEQQTVKNSGEQYKQEAEWKLYDKVDGYYRFLRTVNGNHGLLKNYQAVKNQREKSQNNINTSYRLLTSQRKK